ncbi:sulfotransferase [Oricola sp.]|uniref:tetratricopeptide repeat-containing sulfotransferase family protein n=1 Tax=Oricola sp. TaxID=1979950 RepID=UPI003BAB464B
MSAANKLRKAKNLARAGEFLAAKRVYLEVLDEFPSNRRAKDGLAEIENPDPGNAEDGPDRAEVEQILQLFRNGRFNDVLNAAKPLAGRHPAVGVLHSLIGGAYSRLDLRDEALDSLGRALALNPNDVNAHNAIAVVLTSTNRNAEALVHLKAATRLQPSHADAFANMAIALENAGQRQAALEAVDRALEIYPDFANALRFKSTLQTYVSDDGQIEGLLSALERVKQDSPDAVHLHFALGKAFDDIGDPGRAFHHFHEGNRIRRATFGDVVARNRADFEAIKQVFEDTDFDNPTTTGDDDPRMIFIVGMPRSGTTLVEQILASHSSVFGAGELDFMRREARRYLANDKEGPERKLTILRDNYLRAISNLDPQRPVVVDKMPTNFAWTGFMLSAFPNAAVVRMKRDPIAVCWSIYRRYFPAGGLDFAWDLDDLVSYHRLYEDLMAFWHARFPNRVFEVDYEILTENQERETRLLLDACGLEFEEACLNFHETKRAVNTASTEQIRRKMYTGSSQGWRRYETHLGVLTKAFRPPA